ncbi:hypothetical protein DRO21_07265, partial [archaeon]
TKDRVEPIITEGVRCWLYVINEVNLKVVIEQRIMGISSRYARKYKHLLNELRPGDYVILYVKPGKIAGVFKIVDGPYKDNKPIFRPHSSRHKERFPWRVRLVEVIVPREPKPIKSIVTKLTFVKNPENWQIYFRHTLRQVSLEDLELILYMLESGG